MKYLQEATYDEPTLVEYVNLPTLNRNNFQTSFVRFNEEKTQLQEETGSVKGSEDQIWSGSNVCYFIFVLGAAFVLLWGLNGLVLFWILWYRNGFAWQEDPKREFNFHPFLMVAGMIFLSGHGLLVYRSFLCTRKVINKLLHTIFHLLAIPCIVIGMITVFDSHDLRNPPIPNLYTLHSWLGLITLGLFGLQVSTKCTLDRGNHFLLQFVVGFFSFFILLCCESSTALFRNSLVPVHGAFGITTFSMAVVTCITGLTEKAIFSMQKAYQNLPEEAVVVNTMGVMLASLGILFLYIFYKDNFASQRQLTIYKAETHTY